MNSQSLLSDEMETCPKYFNKIIEFLNHELSNAVNAIRDIVNQHEGFIQVESFERLGSIICLGLKKL